MRGQVALALQQTHAVLGPAGTLVVLALRALVAVVEETLARVVIRAVTYESSKSSRVITFAKIPTK